MLKRFFSLSETITSLLLAFCCKPHFVSFCVYQLRENFSNTKGVLYADPRGSWLGREMGERSHKAVCSVHCYPRGAEKWEEQSVGSEDRGSHH